MGCVNCQNGNSDQAKHHPLIKSKNRKAWFQIQFNGSRWHSRPPQHLCWIGIFSAKQNDGMFPLLYPVEINETLHCAWVIQSSQSKPNKNEMGVSSDRSIWEYISIYIFILWQTMTMHILHQFLALSLFHLFRTHLNGLKVHNNTYICTYLMLL